MVFVCAWYVSQTLQSTMAAHLEIINLDVDTYIGSCVKQWRGRVDVEKLKVEYIWSVFVYAFAWMCACVHVCVRVCVHMRVCV